MGAGIPDDLGGRVEPHGLGIEQGAAEDLRMMALQPGRGIDKERKAGGVAFREPVAGKALKLFETAFRERGVIAILKAPCHEAFMKSFDRSGPTEAAERAAELIGFAGGKACRDDGNLHGLLLEERNPQRLAEDRFQRR